MNTVLITVDALRVDHLGQYGYDRDTMPALDRLLEDGVKFEYAFSNGPYTRISVPAIHTSNRLGYRDIESLPTIASQLSKGDILTACIGTQTGFSSVEGHLQFDEYYDLERDRTREETPSKADKIISKSISRIASPITPVLKNLSPIYRFGQKIYHPLHDRGYSFNYLGYTSAEDVTDKAIEWMNMNMANEFFLWIHYMEGHRPYGIHNEDPAFVDGFSDEEMREAERTAGRRPGEVTVEEHQKLCNMYDSDIKYCSEHLDRLLNTIEDLGIGDQTNIMFTSDHGEEFYDHGMFFHRNLPFDELLHVPLIIQSPVKSSQTITAQRELLDIAPTVLNFHNIQHPDGFTGTDLFQGDSRRVIALGSQRYDQVVAGRWDGYKYIRYEDSEYLFNTVANGREDDNIAAGEANIVRKFSDYIPSKYFVAEEEELRRPDDEIDRKQLEALGYLEVNEMDDEND